MNMIIKSLQEPIEIKFEQYECEVCKKKCYINAEDKNRDFLHCVFCGGESKNVRIFDIEIMGIGEY